MACLELHVSRFEFRRSLLTWFLAFAGFKLLLFVALIGMGSLSACRGQHSACLGISMLGFLLVMPGVLFLLACWLVYIFWRRIGASGFSYGWLIPVVLWAVSTLPLLVQAGSFRTGLDPVWSWVPYVPDLTWFLVVLGVFLALVDAEPWSGSKTDLAWPVAIAAVVYAIGVYAWNIVLATSSVPFLGALLNQVARPLYPIMAPVSQAMTFGFMHHHVVRVALAVFIVALAVLAWSAWRKQTGDEPPRGNPPDGDDADALVWRRPAPKGFGRRKPV